MFAKIAYGLERHLLGLGHGAEQFASCGIGMPSPIEEHLCQDIAVVVVDRPEANPDEVVALGILAEGDGESHALDSQRFVDQSLGVALDEMETPHLLPGEREE